MKKWEGYTHKNTEQDCQLVTAINAYYHLTGKIIEQDSDYYEQLKELAGCVAGSCIDITKVWNELKIIEDKRFMGYDLYKYLKRGCFIELNVWHKYFGFHSVAVVDYIKKADCLRVTNFNHVTSMAGWIFKEDLIPYIIDNPDRSKPTWNGRTFKLINKKMNERET